MSLKHVCFAGAALGLAVSSVSASVVIRYGNNTPDSYSYVTSSQAFDTTNSTTRTDLNEGGSAEVMDHLTRRPFNTSAALTKAAPAYTGPTFYGGYEIWRYDSTTGANTTTQIRNYISGNNGAANTQNDPIQIDVNLPAGTPGTVEYSFVGLFRKADFLDDAKASNATVSFGATGGQLRMYYAGTGTAGSSASNKVRFVIQNGDTIYISSNEFTPAGGSFSPLPNPGATTWAVYDPTTDLEFSGGTFATRTFNDVTAVGFYWHGEATGTAPGVNIRATMFEADATVVVPEPVSGSLIGAGLATGALLARRRRRS